MNGVAKEMVHAPEGGDREHDADGYSRQQGKPRDVIAAIAVGLFGQFQRRRECLQLTRVVDPHFNCAPVARTDGMRWTKRTPRELSASQMNSPC